MGTSGMQTIVNRLAGTRKELAERGTTLLADLQEKGNGLVNDLQLRGEKLVGAGQRALDEVETTVLTRAHGFLGWAYDATGEKSDALRRGRDFLAERLEHADDEDDLDEDAVLTEPVEGYDDYNVKKAIEFLEGAERDEIAAVAAYEAANKARKTVLAAADRLLADA